MKPFVEFPASLDAICLQSLRTCLIGRGGDVLPALGADEILPHVIVGAGFGRGGMRNRVGGDDVPCKGARFVDRVRYLRSRHAGRKFRNSQLRAGDALNQALGAGHQRISAALLLVVHGQSYQ
ncbi:hypothetical protein WS55_22710 [Burkholderia pseudomultivorans]|nr:hypothetical protein WS55_22710 [Burkholderia pseudomultivorans]KVC32079.1 hypothetical protein WS56_14315 [Burkholderia pseudomultivorans]